MSNPSAVIPAKVSYSLDAIVKLFLGNPNLRKILCLLGKTGFRATT